MQTALVSSFQSFTYHLRQYGMRNRWTLWHLRYFLRQLIFHNGLSPFIHWGVLGPLNWDLYFFMLPKRNPNYAKAHPRTFASWSLRRLKWEILLFLKAYRRKPSRAVEPLQREYYYGFANVYRKYLWYAPVYRVRIHFALCRLRFKRHWPFLRTDYPGGAGGTRIGYGVNGDGWQVGFDNWNVREIGRPRWVLLRYSDYYPCAFRVFSWDWWPFWYPRPNWMTT